MRFETPGHRRARPAKMLAVCSTVIALVAPSAALAEDGGSGPLPAPPSIPDGSAIPPAVPVPGAIAKLSADRRTAIPPAAAPDTVKGAIYAANQITRRPYIWGGGHGSFRSRGYDCSGAVSYVLHGAGILASPMDSSDLMRWGEPGRGLWMTVYTNPGHAFIVIAGLRFDTSGLGERGPRWRVGARSSRAFTARHFAGF